MLKRAWLRRCLLRQRTREPRPPTGRMLNPCAALPLLYARTVRWPGSRREALRYMLRRLALLCMLSCLTAGEVNHGSGAWLRRVSCMLCCRLSVCWPC